MNIEQQQQQTYYAECAYCHKKMWDMMNEVPVDNILIQFTTVHEMFIEESFKRFCDLQCVKEWIESKQTQ